MAFPIYHIDLRAERCRLVASVNGITVADIVAHGAAPHLFAPPINLYLKGRQNRLAIEVTPSEEEDLAAADAVVRVYQKGDPVAHGEGEAVADTECRSTLNNRRRVAREHGEGLTYPQSVEWFWDNHGPDFSQEIFACPPIRDEAAIYDFAMHIRGMMKSGDVHRLADVMATKVSAYSAAYDHDAAEIRSSLISVLENGYLARGFDTEFTRDDIETIGHAHGRLREIRCRSMPLIRSMPGADGSHLEMSVFVGHGALGLQVFR